MMQGGEQRQKTVQKLEQHEALMSRAAVGIRIDKSRITATTSRVFLDHFSPSVLHQYVLQYVRNSCELQDSVADAGTDQFTVASPPTDAISALKFSPEPDSTRFVVSSWDKNVYLYDLRDENGNVGEGKLLQKFEHRAPVLDVCFGENENVIYTAGLDWDVRK